MYLRTTLSIIAVCGILILAAATVTDCDASFKRPTPGGTCESTCSQCPGIVTSTSCELAGCTWAPGACTGTTCPETCGDLNETDCESATSCSWGTFECSEDCTSCVGRTPAQCADDPSCEIVAGSCGGTHTDCGNLTQSNCTQANCTLGSCYGNPTNAQPCTCAATENLCTSVYSCSWNGTSCEAGATTQIHCNELSNSQCNETCCIWAPDSCVGEPNDCIVYTGKTDCETFGCTWTPETCDGTCTACEDHTDTTACVLNGCDVISTQGCQATCTPCSTFTTDASCGGPPNESDCSWLSESCQAPASCAESCADNANETDCAGQSGCTWIAD